MARAPRPRSSLDVMTVAVRAAGTPGAGSASISLEARDECSPGFVRSELTRAARFLPARGLVAQLPACLRNVSVEGQAGASAAVVSVNAGCSPQQQLRNGVARDVSGDHGAASAPACAPAGIQEGQIISRGTTDVTIR